MPDLENAVGGKLRSETSGARIQQGTRSAMFFAFGRALQMLVFWWLVIDITADFFYRWTSAMLESEYCRATRYGRATVTGIQWVAPLGTATFTVPMQGDGSATSPGIIFFGGVSNNENPFDWVASGTLRNTSENTRTFEIWVEVTNDGVTTVHGPQTLVIPGRSNMSWSFSGFSFDPGNVSIKFTKDDDRCTIFDTTLSAIGRDPVVVTPST